MARNSEQKDAGAGPREIPRNRQVRAVLFDFDGTLTLPGHLDFAAIREAVDCPAGESLLSFLESIDDPEVRERASQTVERFEAEAADRAEEDPDAVEVIRFCSEHQVRLGIITRNSRSSVARSFARFRGIRADDFDVLITRDDPIAAKPSPQGVTEACRRLGIEVAETFVVGDFLYDIEAGERAGAVTVFYHSDRQRSFERPESDYVIEHLGELTFILSLHLPLPAGKVPNEMLAYFLASASGRSDRLSAGDASPETAAASAANGAAVIVGPGVGEDVAALSLFEELPAAAELLLLKSDPITLVSEGFGRYLLTVNANDIATAGGTPRWLLATLLAPPGTLPVEIGVMFRDLAASCRRAGVALCGGHTELTAAVVRPIVSGTMVGTVKAARLVKKGQVQAGDAVLLTKGIAVEGTAILAADRRHLLIERGVDLPTIERAAALIDQMSVVAEAQIAADHEGIASMHDVTEGGVATALYEVSVAGGHRLRIDLDKIPILPESGIICRALGIDPLGLIGSGSLIICVRPGAAESLQERLWEAHIAVAGIGEVLDSGSGIEARREGRVVPMPRFESDELARLA